MELILWLFGGAIFFFLLGGALERFDESESFFGKLIHKFLLLILLVTAIPILLFWAYGYFMNMTGQL